MSKFIAWLNTHILSLIIAAVVISSVYSIINLVEITRRPPDTNEFKGGIQNHLLWSNKGECFFVRPFSSETVNLVRVEDCDRK